VEYRVLDVMPTMHVARNVKLAVGAIHDARRGGFRDLRLWRRRPVTTILTLTQQNHVRRRGVRDEA
jgi:hypothetical protein